MSTVAAVATIGGVVLTGGALYTGMIMWLSRVSDAARAAQAGVERIDAERDKDKAAFNLRLEKAEGMALEIGRLTEAVRNMGERMVTELSHLRERHDEAQSYNRERFDQIAKEIGHVRSNARMALEAAPRLRNTPVD